MTVYTWPTGDSAFWLKAQTWGAIHNGRSNTSELNSDTQGISLPGTRRTLTLEVPQQTYDERARLAAFFERLNGFEHRVAMWDHARPTPPGLSGSPTVSGAVSQFAETLNIASGGLAGVNMLAKTQQFDAAAWTKASATITANAIAAPNGTTTADKLVTASGTALTPRVSQGFTSVAGVTYVYSIHVKAGELGWVRVLSTGATGATVAGYINLATGAIGAGGSPSLIASQPVPGAAGWYRVSLRIDATVSGAAVVYTQTANVDNAGTMTGDGTSGIYVWGAQLEVESVMSDYSGLPTVTPGDWLSLVTSTGNQLVKVVNTVVADTSDLLTGVEIRHALRGSVANGSAVTIVRPTGLYVQRNPDQVLMPRGGRNLCPPVSIELVEVFS